MKIENGFSFFTGAQLENHVTEGEHSGFIRKTYNCRAEDDTFSINNSNISTMNTKRRVISFNPTILNLIKRTTRLFVFAVMHSAETLNQTTISTIFLKHNS